jgi:hypothetical protein
MKTILPRLCWFAVVGGFGAHIRDAEGAGRLAFSIPSVTLLSEKC